MTIRRFLQLFGIAALLTLGFGSVALATTITVIQGTDTLSASRTTFNNNFSALNNGKPEISGDIGGTSSTPRLSITNQATGSILYFSAGRWNALASGTPGQVLTASSSSPFVAWSNASSSESAERCDIDFVIENGIASERDHARAFGSTSTLTRVLAWNKGPSDSMTFNIGITSAFNTATSSLDRMFASDQTVATTTLTALTANGSTTVGALKGLVFLSSAASSTHFGVTVCYE